MAITTAWNANKRLDALNAVVSTAAGRLKMALIKPGNAGTYNASYATYVAGMSGDEVAAGNGYTQGGITLTGVTNALSGGVAQSSHADAVWTAATISADGCVIYDSGDSNKVIACLDFGGTKTSTADLFTVKSPSGGFVSI